MVLVAVSILGTTELMFIEPGVKINGAYYRDVLLGQHLLPTILSVAGDFFTYNAPAHRAGDTVQFLSRNTPDFTSPLPWPPAFLHFIHRNAVTTPTSYIVIAILSLSLP